MQQNLIQATLREYQKTGKLMADEDFTAISQFARR
jgi:hypothetical protein